MISQEEATGVPVQDPILPNRSRSCNPTSTSTLFMKSVHEVALHIRMLHPNLDCKPQDYRDGTHWSAEFFIFDVVYTATSCNEVLSDQRPAKDYFLREELVAPPKQDFFASL